MYANVQSSINAKEFYSEIFPVKVGTMQWCNLSPSLFNCYLNNIPKLLDKISAAQPTLANAKVSCLIYADDLVLISKTKSGPQNLISATERYCNKCQLTINVDKTKILIVHKRAPQPFKLVVYGKQIV